MEKHRFMYHLVNWWWYKIACAFLICNSLQRVSVEEASKQKGPILIIYKCTFFSDKRVFFFSWSWYSYKFFFLFSNIYFIHIYHKKGGSLSIKGLKILTTKLVGVYSIMFEFLIWCQSNATIKEMMERI